ncbi:hypothetical protein F5Y10DRAFT_268771 [Nemania abortiva]|nr:hypothetical protein F5Y10DRAFT_268771 [Nemania abortiva]
MASSSRIRSTMEATVRDFLQSPFEATDTGDLRAISRRLTPECRRQLAPRSFLLHLETLTPDNNFDNAHSETAFRENFKVCRVKWIEVVDLVLDEAARRASARTKTVVSYHDDSEIEIETCWFFELVENGTQIQRIVEFVGEEMAARKHVKNMTLLRYRKSINMALIG